MNTSPNLWQGQYTQGLATAALLNANTLKSGLFRIEENIKGDKAIVKVFNYTGDLVEGNFCNSTPTDTSSMSDILVPVTQFKVHERICKTNLVNTSYADTMRASVWNDSIDLDVMRTLVTRIAVTQTKYLEDLRWSGDTASGTARLAHQDGIVTQLKAGSAIRPTFVAGNLINPATVIAELNKVLTAAPQDIRFNPKFSLIISTEVFNAYQQAMANNQSYAMYALFGAAALVDMQKNAPAYVGKFVGTNVSMYIASGLSAVAANQQVAIGGIFSNDEESNFVVCTDALSDADNIIVQDRSMVFAADQNVDFDWSFRHGVKVLFTNQVVLLAV